MSELRICIAEFYSLHTCYCCLFATPAPIKLKVLLPAFRSNLCGSRCVLAGTKLYFCVDSHGIPLKVSYAKNANIGWLGLLSLF